MPPKARKFALCVHLTVSIGWIGAVLGYLALGVAAVASADDQTVRSSWTAMEITGWYVIVPLAVASWITGLVMAYGTAWGVLRHYWVVISLVLTSVAVLVLLLHMPDVSAAADIARTAAGDDLAALGGDLAHAALGLAVLLTIQALNIYKPRGLTRYGHRHRERVGSAGRGLAPQ